MVFVWKKLPEIIEKTKLIFVSRYITRQPTVVGIAKYTTI